MTHHFLLRDQAPLTAEQWRHIDNIVIQTARRQLMGRRLLPIYGPLGAGALAVQIRRLSPPSDAAIGLMGQEEAQVTTEDRDFIPIPILYRDFVVNWRNIEHARQFGAPLDLSQAATAAAAVARREDELIFLGDQNLGHVGILNAPGRTTVPLGDWGQPTGAFNNIVSAVTKLGSQRFFGPYAVVASPGLFVHLNRLFDNTGVLEIEQVRRLAQAGVFLSPVLPEPTAVVVSVGAENLDLAVAQDITTAYLQVENLNHYFRVFEAVTLRIKQPSAIATLEHA
ncbi:MAG: family 1 encapsulin nanocompartment shell protein [Chloroflexota bacterium]